MKGKIQTMLLVAGLALLGGCGKAPNADDAGNAGDIVNQHLATAVASAGTDDTVPGEVTGAEKSRRALRVKKVKKFLKKPEHREVVKELFQFVKENEPSLLPKRKPKSRAEALPVLASILSYLQEHYDELSPEAQALLDKAEKLKAQIDQPDSTD